MDKTRQRLFAKCCCATFLLLVTACSSDELDVQPNQARQTAISLAGSNINATRADVPLPDYGVTTMKVYGIKGAPGQYETVFDSYHLWYAANSANTTESNTHGWEYVGRDHQTIKYWDYSANHYIFWAVANADRLSGGFTPDATSHLVQSATFTVSDQNLNDPQNILYYTKPTVIKKGEAYGKPVQLKFQRAASRIRFAFYEVIPGYAVKQLKFYTTGTGASTTGTTDCTINGSFITAAQMTLTYDVDATNDYATPSATLTYGTRTTATSKAFGQLQYTFADDNRLTGTAEADRIYVGKESSAPTYALGEGADGHYYSSILPYADNTSVIQLKMDFTLLSTDGSGQEITVHGASAIVPAAYCRWQPNYAYTYLFKITDDTNGSTKPGDGTHTGLYPITFAAYTVTGDGQTDQGTITTLGTYSITTTRQEGDETTTGIEYVATRPINVSVSQMSGSSTAASQVTLQAESATGATDWLVIYHQETGDESVIETTTTTSTDPADGLYKETIDAINNGIATFTPDKPGTYRIEYWHKEGESPAEALAIKIIKIGDAPAADATMDITDGEDTDARQTPGRN